MPVTHSAVGRQGSSPGVVSRSHQPCRGPPDGPREREDRAGSPRWFPVLRAPAQSSRPAIEGKHSDWWVLERAHCVGPRHTRFSICSAMDAETRSAVAMAVRVALHSAAAADAAAASGTRRLPRTCLRHLSCIPPGPGRGAAHRCSQEAPLTVTPPCHARCLCSCIPGAASSTVRESAAAAAAAAATALGQHSSVACLPTHLPRCRQRHHHHRGSHRCLRKEPRAASLQESPALQPRANGSIAC